MSRRRRRFERSVWEHLGDAPGHNGNEPLPVLMGRMSSPENTKGAKLGPQFCTAGSNGSDDNALLRDILSDALVSPLLVQGLPDLKNEEKTPCTQNRGTQPAQGRKVRHAQRLRESQSSSTTHARERKVQFKEGRSSGAPAPDMLQTVHINVDPHSNECKTTMRKSSMRSSKRQQSKREEFAIANLDNAATTVQKSYRGHRVRRQVPKLKEQTRQRLETVEEEAQIQVTFEVETRDREEGRSVDRKKTPYIRKEDIPPHESMVQFVSPPVSPPEIPRDIPRWKLRERKLTGFVKKADLVDESESETESEKEDCSPKKVMEIVTPREIADNTVPDESDSEDEGYEV